MFAAPPAPTVLLFDIDGTLCDTAGAGRRAIARAFEALHGRPDACDDLGFSGLTDPRIARHGLTTIAAACDPAAIDALIATYVGFLEAELAATAGCRALPGVAPLLDRLAPLRGPTLALGLGTGNVERGARLKLRRVALDHHFAFGGFGCDAEDRAALLAAGADRGATQLGQPRAACRVVVIGDTPLDVQAAHAIGADCLAVATGRFTADALAAEGPRVVLADLTDPAVPDLLLGRG